MSIALHLHPHKRGARGGALASLPTQPTPVLLLSLPFGLPYMPSLGLSLLKAGLAARGIAADVQYLGLRFAHIFGYPLYQRLAHGGGGSFLGDWIFYPALYGPPSEAHSQRFWQLAFADRSPRGLAPSFEALQERIAAAQEQACTFIEQCLHEIPWTQYALVGFTTMFQQNLASLALARRVKAAHPDVPIVFGGPNAEGQMGASLMACFPCIDYVFSGESDHSFPAFAEAVLAGAPTVSLPGMFSRQTPGGAVQPPASWGEPIQDMDALPYPNFDEFFAQFHAAFPQLRPHLNYETARGCWWGAKSHCTFCGLNGMTMAFRSKSPQRALDEIRYLHQTYMVPHRVLLMQPTDQILDLRYFHAMIPQLPEAAPGIPTFFETKANLSRAQVKALAASGVQILQPGIESLSSRVLKLMRKGCTQLQNVQLLKWCAEFGVFPIWNFLYGFPGEEAADYDQVSALVPRLTHLQPPKKCLAIELDRFSPYFMTPHKLGVTNIRPPEIFSLLYPFDAQQQRDLSYTFAFDYADSREAASYVGSALERVARLWIQSRQRGALVGFYNAERLLIWDSRLGAIDRWVELRGPYRDALLQADRILAEHTVQAVFAATSDAAQAETARDDFLAHMEQRGLVLREAGRVLSLVVLHATDHLPKVPAAQVVSITPPIDAAQPPPATALGGAAVDRVLAGPRNTSDRYHVVIQASLFSTTPARQSLPSTVRQLDGVGVVESFWGTSAFRITGTLTLQCGEPARLELTAERVSGFDAGGWTLSFCSDHPWVGDNMPTAIAGQAHYSDAVNPALSMHLDITGLLAHDAALACQLSATGEGFHYASFLASGETLGGAEGV